MKHLIIRSFVGFLACWICLLAPATAADYTLMVFGDSLSASYGIDEDAGWVNLLAIQIEDTQLPFVVVNGSVSGETTTGGLSRLPSLLDNYAPELVILELGGNDGLRGLPLAQMRQNLSAMVDLIEQAGADVLLAGIQIPPNYGPRYTIPFFEIYAELAQEKNLALVPFLIDGIPQQPELIQSDGIHPVAEAQSMILNNVWPWLEPMLQKIADSGS
ncbi:MAG TPA: arylesterase [Gammaproteobacteria bacterium]|jgi:acyl-CoA thioesterase-1|nr:arylesterase [Gammaproteobacteria bacterium]HAT26570.1 arylesterase [Gammaproteobacteria bacterium]HIF86301.1 arylesterase [Gammaproteobacteria bacterium]HIL63062.1 arylesterase [Porticoccaceae bacterium]